MDNNYLKLNSTGVDNLIQVSGSTWNGVLYAPESLPDPVDVVGLDDIGILQTIKV
jgi:hypothetical protein